MKKVPLNQIATFNPSAPVLSGAEELAFVPMAAVSEQGQMAVSETLVASDLKSGYNYMQSGDVLVAKITPCYENNKIAVADFQQRHGFGSTEFHVIRVRGDRLNNRFLLHYLRQDRVRAEGARRMTGSAGQRRVPRSFLEELKIPLPPLVEQRRIAAILDQADDLRRLRREAWDTLQRFVTSSFYDIFGDPVVNPRRWPVIRLGVAGQLDRGVSKRRPRNDPALLGGPYPLVQTGDIANCDGHIGEYRSTYSELGLNQSRLWPAGTLCITIAANIGKVGVLQFDACFPDSVVGFKPKKEFEVDFVREWFKFLQPILERDAPQSAQKNINLAILRDLEIIAPPAGLQRAFAARVAEIDKLKGAHRAHLEKLNALFASLQNSAFRGGLGGIQEKVAEAIA